MLRSAIEAGADSVYCGLRDETNARNFPGLNFSAAELADSVAFAHQRAAKVLVAVNTFARAGATDAWRRAVDTAVAAGADALIAADLAVLAYAQVSAPLGEALLWRGFDTLVGAVIAIVVTLLIPVGARPQPVWSR